ncbi:MAG TPA: nucleoside hydrolase [Tissierellales bacterium]|nr:nucleoside hydrolase [Tissierellales bacterium]
MKMKKVIIDVDTGIDDALALILAIKSKKLDVKGITTVAGNVPARTATVNTLKILKILEKEDIPVCEGMTAPLLRGIQFSDGVHGLDGLGGALRDMEVKYHEGIHGVDFIIETVMKNKKEMTIILLGPPTNMAFALKKEPKIKEYIKEIVMMGGAINGIGNETRTAEFNFYTDPESVRVVFESGIPIKMVGLDVTNNALIYRHDLKRFCNRKPIANFTKDVLEYYINKCSQLFGIENCSLHDPLAVATVIDPSIVKTKEYYVDIEANSELCDGMTVCDFNNILGREPNVEVAVDGEYEKFINYFVDIVNR